MIIKFYLVRKKLQKRLHCKVTLLITWLKRATNEWSSHLHGKQRHVFLFIYYHLFVIVFVIIISFNTASLSLTDAKYWNSNIGKKFHTHHMRHEADKLLIEPRGMLHSGTLISSSQDCLKVLKDVSCRIHHGTSSLIIKIQKSY